MCSWTRINPGLVPFYIRDIWIPATHAIFSGSSHTELSSGVQFVSSFDQSEQEILGTARILSNTEILPVLQQQDIGHKTCGIRDRDTTCKSLRTKNH